MSSSITIQGLTYILHSVDGDPNGRGIPSRIVLERDGEAGEYVPLSLLAPELEKAKLYDAYQLDLERSKIYAERLVKMVDAEEAEVREKARKWDKVMEPAYRVAMFLLQSPFYKDPDVQAEVDLVIALTMKDVLTGKEAENG